MDFTREPIIETVITPKEGCKLVVRSSKNSAQEEYFVDAVEVVSFGNSFFFRSLERPKSFLVPASDYEILEVREARMVLKNVGLDRSIKIGGGREPSAKPIREPASADKIEPIPAPPEEAIPQEAGEAALPEARLDKKRDRRSRYRRRRSREEISLKENEASATELVEEGEKIELQAPAAFDESEEGVMAAPLTSAPTILSSILPPPPTLISETIARYKDNAMFKGAFFLRDEEKKDEEGDTKNELEFESMELPQSECSETPSCENVNVPIDEPLFHDFDLTEKDDVVIFQHENPFSIEEEPKKNEFDIKNEGDTVSNDVKDSISNGNS